MSTRVQSRVRILLGRTARDGWIPETTVEFQWDGQGVGEEQDEEALHQIGQLLKQVRFLAYAEANDRNRLEGRPSVWKDDPALPKFKGADKDTQAIIDKHTPPEARENVPLTFRGADGIEYDVDTGERITP